MFLGYARSLASLSAGLLAISAFSASNSPLAFAKHLESESDLKVQGTKFPNSPEEGITPVVDQAHVPPASLFTQRAEPGTMHSYRELVPFSLRSPDQEDAGSCLYMSLTGIAELWLARLHPEVARTPDGPLDLSERYLMNIAGRDEDSSDVEEWRTDSIYLLNKKGYGVLNSTYRFTKGWTKDGDDGYEKAKPNDKDAEFATTYNWIDELSSIRGGKVELPQFEREILFADPEHNQWNVGVMPDDIVERVKTAMLQRQAPVHVIYNHEGYWHAVNILGFDDEASSRRCEFVSSMRSYFPQTARQARAAADREQSPKQKALLIKKAEKNERLSRLLEAAYEKGGGCHPKGMFYVRDSIYSAKSEPLYEYAPGAKSHYSKAVIYREYDWLRYIANHASVIYAK